MKRDFFFSFAKLAYVKGDKPKKCILCCIRNNDPDVIDLTIYRDDLFIVSLNLYPYNPGHLLIFPLRHIEDIREYSKQEENRFDVLNRFFLDSLDKTHTPSGYNLGYNMGLASGASIKHLHYHVIPRYPRETGIADLIANKRVLVEDPRDSHAKILNQLKEDIDRSDLASFDFQLGSD